MNEVHDPGVRSALKSALGHDAPFSDDDLSGVTKLRVHRAAELSVLASCTGLEELELVGCDARTLEHLALLRKLRVVRVLASRLDDVSALENAASLEELQIDFCFIRDLNPVASLPALQRGRFVGNPLDDSTWHEVRRRMQGAVLPSTGDRPVLEFGSENAWQITRRLWDGGIRLCFALLDDLRPVLVRPGSSIREGVEVDATRATEARLIMAADAREDGDELFEKIRSFWDRKGQSRTTDFASHRILGNRSDALSWIAAAPDGDRADMARFISRFPDAVFFRETDRLHSLVSQTAGCPYPAPLAASRAVLAGAMPDERPVFQLEPRIGRAPRSPHLAEIWYVPAAGVYTSEERRAMFRGRAGLFPIAEWIETGRSILASAISESDASIYEFGEQDLFDAAHDGRDLAKVPARAFRSHAELLAHVSALRLSDGTVVPARRDSES